MIEKKVESITKAYNDVVEETSKTIFQVRKFLGLWKNKLYLLQLNLQDLVSFWQNITSEITLLNINAKVVKEISSRAQKEFRAFGSKFR